MAVGAVIADRYRVERKLGAGGMGEVFLATRLEDEGTVVIKTLLASWATDAVSRKRFAREAEAASTLVHPGVVRILDYHDDPVMPFLVMEHVEGRTLSDVIRATPAMPFERAIELCRQVLNALAAAHELGIVHRDLKPANIMVSEASDGAEKVTVLDFGLAHILDDERRTRLTQTGQVLGTPSYLAPEQAKGEAVDGRTDLWAVGVTLYVALTSHLPFPGADARERILAMLIKAPTPLRVHRPDAPASIEAVIVRCLQKDPNDRYATATAFSEALTCALASPQPAAPADVTVMARPRARPAPVMHQTNTSALAEAAMMNGTAARAVPAKRHVSRLWLVAGAAMVTILFALTLGLVLKFVRHREPIAAQTQRGAPGPVAVGLAPMHPSLAPAANAPPGLAPAEPQRTDTEADKPQDTRSAPRLRRGQSQARDPGAREIPDLARAGARPTRRRPPREELDPRARDEPTAARAPPSRRRPPQVELDPWARAQPAAMGAPELVRSGLPSHRENINLGAALRYVNGHISDIAPCFHSVRPNMARSYRIDIAFDEGRGNARSVHAVTSLFGTVRRCIERVLGGTRGQPGSSMSFKVRWR